MTDCVECLEEGSRAPAVFLGASGPLCDAHARCRCGRRLAEAEDVVFCPECDRDAEWIPATVRGSGLVGCGATGGVRS